MKTKFISAIIIISAFGISNVNAQAKQKALNPKLHLKGSKSVQATTVETQNKDQKDTRATIKLVKTDGVATASEKRVLQKKRTIQNSQVYKKRHPGLSAN